MLCQEQIYHSRKPKESALWQCLHDYFLTFIADYEQEYVKSHGFFRPSYRGSRWKISWLRGFEQRFCPYKMPRLQAWTVAVVFLPGRWFCPTCHQKKVLLFGEFISNEVAFPVPHRQYVFSIPIMLRIYFKYDRKLVTRLCKMGLFRCLFQRNFWQRIWGGTCFHGWTAGLAHIRESLFSWRQGRAWKDCSVHHQESILWRKDDIYSETGKVIYKSKQNVKTKRNFEVFEAPDFIAHITQHIPRNIFSLSGIMDGIA